MVTVFLQTLRKLPAGQYEYGMSRGRPEERTSLSITPQKDELEFVIAPVVESVGVLVVAVAAAAAAA